MNIIGTEPLPIKSWCAEVEPDAMQQARDLANLPFAFKHIALMPDCHFGYGMPIGGVLATKDVVVPNAVGVDIGCGMTAVRTNLFYLDKDVLKKIMELIRKKVPVGFHRSDSKVDNDLMPDPGEGLYRVVSNEYENARYQLGTLGGGNHFIEIQKGSDGYVWVMIHSGSRNLGKQVADYYNKQAKELNKAWFSSVDPSVNLAFLPIDSEESMHYLREMEYCIDFALANRKLMVDRVLECFDEAGVPSAHAPIINIPHNYASLENHFGENVWVHRKGATRARSGETGIIPGSQGSKSYIVEGLGNIQSFMSCSHGAGRRMGRKQAQKSLSLEDEIKHLDALGVVHSVRHVSDLDEAPGAYKDIQDVMAQQMDLVKILVELTPLAVIKG